MWRIVVLILIGVLVIDVCWEMLGRHARRQAELDEVRRHNRARRMFE